MEGGRMGGICVVNQSQQQNKNSKNGIDADSSNHSWTPGEIRKCFPKLSLIFFLPQKSGRNDFLKTGTKNFKPSN